MTLFNTPLNIPAAPRALFTTHRIARDVGRKSSALANDISDGLPDDVASLLHLLSGDVEWGDEAVFA
jgi:hypothetical protein